MSDRFAWERALLASDVPSRARLTGLVLATHWPDVRPSIARLVKMTGQSRRTVMYALADLEDAGLILRTGKPTDGKPTVYKLTGYTRATDAHPGADNAQVGATDAHPPCNDCTPPVQQMHTPCATIAPKHTKNREENRQENRRRRADLGDVNASPPREPKPPGDLKRVTQALDAASDWRPRGPGGTHREGQLLQRIKRIIDAHGADACVAEIEGWDQVGGVIESPVGYLEASLKRRHRAPLPEVRRQPRPGPAWNVTEDLSADIDF